MHGELIHHKKRWQAVDCKTVLCEFALAAWMTVENLLSHQFIEDRLSFQKLV